jgi:nitrogen-specific signal transduction histidine kinase
MVDPILIEQVLVNLMKNAAESIDTAARPGAAQRRAAGIAQDRGGLRAVEFSVTDTGQGWPPEVHGAPVRGLLLHQGEGMGIGPEPVPQHRGIAPRPDAGARTSTMVRRLSAAASPSGFRSADRAARKSMHSRTPKVTA